MTNSTWEDRFDELERALRDEQQEREKLQSKVQPLVELYNAGAIIGKLLWIVGGLTVGIATVWAAISGWVTSHWK